MGGFFILRKDGLPDGAAALTRVDAIARSMGFGAAESLDDGNYHFRFFPKIGGRHPLALVRRANGDFAFACGTMIYEGKIGAEALDAVCRALDAGTDPLDRCTGHFALILKRDGRVRVLNDRFGGYQIYYDMERRAIGTSFLMMSAALPALSFSRQGIYEYVFNGIVSGNDSLLREVLRLPIGGEVELADDGFTLSLGRLDYPVTSETRSFEEHLESVATLLTTYTESIGRIFGNEVSTALSGGYDSRLLLALLRHAGVKPRLYVYGPRGDEDVVVAEAIARGEDLPLEVIDKGVTHNEPVDQFPAIVERNFWANDGHVWSGIFDNGAETEERVRRVADGAIAINGGGGEILRNFFYLRPGAYSPRQLLWTFYSQYDPWICTRAFHPENYYRHLEAKIGELVGEDHDRLARPTVEWLYHSFRCRSWDGKVNSDNNRFGHTALPYQEHRLTAVGSRIPVAIKNHGAFEAALINRIDPRLARYPSVYGHDFASPPPLQRKLLDYTTMLRPTRLRRLTFRLKYRARQALGGLPADYVAAALPGRPEFVERFFVLDRVLDPGQMNRILTLEYLARRLGGKVDAAVD